MLVRISKPRELRSIAASGGCVFTDPLIRMTTEVPGPQITSPTAEPTTSLSSLFAVRICGAPVHSFDIAPIALSHHAATMVASGFNGVFYVDKSSAVEPASCLAAASRVWSSTTLGHLGRTAVEPETFRIVGR